MEKKIYKFIKFIILHEKIEMQNSQLVKIEWFYLEYEQFFDEKFLYGCKIDFFRFFMKKPIFFVWSFVEILIFHEMMKFKKEARLFCKIKILKHRKIILLINFICAWTYSIIASSQILRNDGILINHGSFFSKEISYNFSVSNYWNETIIIKFRNLLMKN